MDEKIKLYLHVITFQVFKYQFMNGQRLRNCYLSIVDRHKSISIKNRVTEVARIFGKIG